MLWLFAPSLIARGSGYPNTSVHRFMNTPAALRQRHDHAVRHTAFLIFMRGLAAAAGLLGAAGMNAQTGTALVRHAPSLSGSVDGSVQQMAAEPVSLNGRAAISGDLLVPGLPVVTVSGHPIYGGTADGTGGATPADYQVTISGSASLGHVLRRSDPVALPAVSTPPAPVGTRNVTLSSSTQSAGDFGSLRDLTLTGNVGQVAIPPGDYGAFVANGNGGFILGVAGAIRPAVYNLQSLTLTGNGRLDVVGPVVLNLAGNVALANAAGSSAHPQWLVVRIASGDLSVRGSLWGYAAAPAGSVILNGGAQLTGGVAADRLALAGNSLLRLVANQAPNVTLTAPTNGAAFVAPVSVALAAAASDADGDVVQVDFYEGANLVGTSTAAPYGSALNNLFPGTYVLTAKATDNFGASSVSSPVTITVGKAPATVTLGDLSQTYDGTAKAASATTAPGGLAVELTYDGSPNAPVSAGSYAVSATVNDPIYAGETAGTFVIAKANPVITWSAPADIVYGTPLAAAQLNATASVPGTFTYSPAIGTVLNAGVAQTLSVTFTPADASDFTGASASVALTVNKAPAGVALTGLDHTYDGSPKGAVATTTPAGLAVALTYNGAVAAPAGAGSYSVLGTISDANYFGSASGTLVIAKATPVVSWNAPADVVYGTALSATQLNASANVPGGFTYTPAAGTVLNAGAAQMLSVAFTPADGANYNPTGAATTLTVTKAAASVAFGNLNQIYDGSPKSVTATTTPVGLAVSVSYNGAGAAPTAAGSYGVQATVDDTNYTGSAADTLVVAKATPLINWSAPASIVYGTALSATQLNATTSVAGTFAYTPPAGTLLSAGAGQILNTAFTPADAANYNAATATTTIDVLAPVPATIAFDSASSATILTATTSLSWSHTLSADIGNNRALVVGVVSRGSSIANASVSGVKFNGVAMIPLTTSIANAGSGTFNRSQLFYLLEASLPPAGTYQVQVSFAVSQSTSNNPLGGAISLINVDQNAPTGFSNNNASANLITTTVPATSGSWVVDTVGVGSTGANLLINATGMVQRFLVPQPGPNSGAAGATSVAGSSGSVTMSWKSASARQAQSLAVFAPALSVPTPPLITTHPASQTVNVGTNVTLNVAATGTAPLSYQWFKNGGPLSGATASSLALTNVQTTASGSYTVTVTNPLGSVSSNPAVLTVNVQPVVITTQPVSQTVNLDDPVTFTVAATGTAPLAYQWYHDGALISGATGTSFARAQVQADDAGSYQVIVSNAAGPVPSDMAVLTINSAPQPPTITTQPVSQTAGVGSSVTFLVAANGTGPLFYQWQKDGVDIPSANSATFTVNNVQLTDAGSYRVFVSNAVDDVPSNAATLTVNALTNPSSRYDLTGFATLGAGTTGGGVVAETSSTYRKVYTALDLANALKDSKTAGAVKVIEIMNDLNLGWNEIGTAAQTVSSGPFRQHAVAKLHPALIAAGVSLVDIQSKPGLTIFSANGATIKHATFNLKGTSNIVIRNLKFDEMWEWDEASKGNYDSNDWDFIDLSNGSPATNVWIDHCTFTKAYDGIVDMKAGTQFVTMSWCRYIGDDGATNPNSFVRQQLAALEANKSSYAFYNFLRTHGFSVDEIALIIEGHDKAHLLGSNSLDSANATLSATFHHQLFQDIWDRCVPRLRAGQVHNYNIFVDDSVALVAKRLRDARANAMSTADRNTLNNTYSFNPFLNGSISTEGGALLVEKSVYMDCITPLRNNQTDVTDPTYTGKILSTDSLYIFHETDGTTTTQRGDSTDAGSRMGPFQAAIIPFSWNTSDGNRPYPAPPMDDPATLEGIVGVGAGAGVISWTKDNWLKTTY
jgi:pectate lyase